MSNKYDFSDGILVPVLAVAEDLFEKDERRAKAWVEFGPLTYRPEPVLAIEEVLRNKPAFLQDNRHARRARDKLARKKR